MKNFNLKLMTALLLVFLTTAMTHAQDSTPQTVMLYIHSETKGTELHKSLVVISPNGQYEVAMEKRTLKTIKESDISNLKIIYDEINKWKQKGYNIEATESEGYLGLTFIIMSKD